MLPEQDRLKSVYVIWHDGDPKELIQSDSPRPRGKGMRMKCLLKVIKFKSNSPEFPNLLEIKEANINLNPFFR